MSQPPNLVLPYASPAWGSRAFVSPVKRGWVAIALICLSLLSGFGVAVANWHEMVLVRQYVIEGKQGKAMAIALDISDWWVGIASLVALIVWIGAVIAFVLWVYRAYKNLFAFPGVQRTYTPARAVGVFFIPFVNLFKIYQVMREIWLGSTTWEDEGGSARLIVWWWFFYLVPTLSRFVMGYVVRAGGSYHDYVLMNNWMAIAESVVKLIAGVLAIAMVLKINRMQVMKGLEISERPSMTVDV